MKTNTNFDTGIITYTFDGDVADVTFDLSTVNPMIKLYAMVDRLQNKVRDTAAIPRKQPNGTTITVTDTMRRAKVVEMVDHLQSGTDSWNLPTGPRAPARNPTILKLAEKHGITYEEAEAKLAEAMLADLI